MTSILLFRSRLGVKIEFRFHLTIVCFCYAYTAAAAVVCIATFTIKKRWYLLGEKSMGNENNKFELFGKGTHNQLLLYCLTTSHRFILIFRKIGQTFGKIRVFIFKVYRRSKFLVEVKHFLLNLLFLECLEHDVFYWACIVLFVWVKIGSLPLAQQVVNLKRYQLTWWNRGWESFDNSICCL